MRANTVEFMDTTSQNRALDGRELTLAPDVLSDPMSHENNNVPVD